MPIIKLPIKSLNFIVREDMILSGRISSLLRDISDTFEKYKKLVADALQDKYVLSRIITATQSLNFPSTNAGEQSSLSISMSGAQVNDLVLVNPPITSDGVFIGKVTALSTVSITYANITTSAKDPAAQDFHISVIGL